jgi:hypothetical protein
MCRLLLQRLNLGHRTCSLFLSEALLITSVGRSSLEDTAIVEDIGSVPPLVFIILIEFDHCDFVLLWLLSPFSEDLLVSLDQGPQALNDPLSFGRG